MSDSMVGGDAVGYIQSDALGNKVGILGNESLIGVDLDDQVVMVPAQLFDVRKNEPAFIFSAENLRTIKRYVARVHRLPADRGRLAAMADFAALGLSLGEVYDFYEELRAHIRSWTEIEVATKRFGNELQLFSETLLNTGGEFVFELKTTKAWMVQDVRLDNMGQSQVRKLSDNDLSILKDSVDTYLAAIREDIADKLNSILGLMALTENFAETIASSLKPQADSFVEALNKQDVSGNLANLEAQLTQLDILIREKTSEYRGLVGVTCSGLVFGIGGVLVSGSMYGPSAEVARHEKNELVGKRLKLLEEKNGLGPLHEGFEDTKTVMLDLQFRLVEVKTAVKHLHDVWLLLHTYVNESMERLDVIDTNARLKKFVFQFERVIRPWETILGISKDISVLFNETLKEDFEGV